MSFLKQSLFVAALTTVFLGSQPVLSNEVKKSGAPFIYCYFRSHNDEADLRWKERIDNQGQIKRNTQITATDPSTGKVVTIDILIELKLLGEFHPHSHAEFFDYKATYKVNNSEPSAVVHQLDRFAGYVFSQFSVDVNQLDRKFVVLADRATPEEKLFMSENVTMTTFCERQF